MNSLRLYLLKVFCIYGTVLSYPSFANNSIVSQSLHQDIDIVSVVNKSGVIGTGFFISPNVVATALHNIDLNYDPIKDNVFLIHAKTGEKIAVSAIRNTDFKNDIILLNVENYISARYYDVDPIPNPAHLKSQKSYVLGVLNGKLVQLNGSTPYSYSKEDPFLSRITYLPRENIHGLSGSPIFAENGQLIGIVNGYQKGISLIFTQIQAVQRLFYKRSDVTKYNNAKIAILETVDQADRATQFRLGWHELNKVFPYPPNMSEMEKQKIRNGQVGIAFHWFKRSAEQGYAPAMLELANIHLKGMGVFKVDIHQFKLLVEQSANKGFAPAQHTLGIFLINIKNHFDTAIHWLQSAARQGYFGDISSLTVSHTEGIPWEEIIKALNILSESGHPQARTLLADYLFKGSGIDQDIKRATELLNQAVSDRFPFAIHYLSDLHRQGMYGYPQDNREALALHIEAEQLGYKWHSRPRFNGRDIVTRMSKGMLEACRGVISSLSPSR